MDWKAKYGRVARLIEGIGAVRASGGELRCSIEVAQLSDASIHVHCVPEMRKPENHSISAGWVLSGPEFEVVGTTKDGRKLRTDQCLLTHSTLHLGGGHRPPVEFEGVTTWAEIGREPERAKKVRARFGVTNFDFIGNAPKEVAPHSFLHVLRVNVPVLGEIVIEPIGDYRDVVTEIKAQRSIAVTCELLLDCKISQVGTVTEQVDSLCSLLSFVRGTPIAWSYRDISAVGRHTAHTLLRDSVTGPYAGPAVIPANAHPQATPDFIHHAWEPYRRLADSYRLGVVLAAYLDAKRPHTFLQSRGLAATVALELLASRCAELEGHETILDSGIFSDMLSELREVTQQVLKRHCPEVRGEDLVEFKRRVQWLNRTSLRYRLRRLMNQFSVPTRGAGGTNKARNAEIGRIVDIRNALVHRASFGSDDPREEAWHDYARLVNFLDRVLLCMLNYRGLYWDILGGRLSRVGEE